MNKFFRKNQKKLLAVFGAFLMVVFILPSTLKNNNGNAGTNAAATLNGTKVTARDLALSKDEWEQLCKWTYRDINRTNEYQPVRFVDEILGRPGQNANAPSPAQIISQNSATFYLLVQEAKKAGIVANPEEVISKLHNNVSPEFADDDEMAQAEPAMADLLIVRDLLERQGDVVKVSKPMRDLALAQTSQEMTLNVAGFPASDYLAKVPAPTTQQIRDQYDAHSDSLPDLYGVAADPLGFGYKYPNRSKVDYIGIKRADVHVAAEASKTPLDWYLAAFTEFKSNRSHYDEMEVDVPATPATQPTTQATQPAAAHLLAASTQPTMAKAVRKLDDVNADFKLHADLVLNDLYERETSQLTGTIAKKISETMKADFGAWRDAQNGKGATTRPMTALGAPYDSWAYMVDLAQSIQKQYGLMPTYGRVDRFETAKQLADTDNIGKAYLVNGRRELPFPTYAAELVQSTISDEAKKSIWAPAALAINQPSNAIIDNEDVYIFRVTAADASHTAPLAEVQDQVIADYKLAQAYDLASKAAKAVLADARTHNFPSALMAAGRPGVTVTDPFVPEGPEGVVGAGADAKILPLKIKADSAIVLARAAEKLLSTGDETLHPMSLVELYSDATPMVIQLETVKAGYPAEMANLYNARMSYVLGNEQSYALISALVQYDTIANRLNYKPIESDKGK